MSLNRFFEPFVVIGDHQVHSTQSPAFEIPQGNVLNYVQKVLEIEKGHGKKVCVDQNTHLHPSGGNHDPWQEV